MPASLIASYAVYANAQNSNPLVTPSFSPANGEILVVKLATWSSATSMSQPTGGGLTFEPAIIAAPAGFFQWSGIYFVGVTGSPTNMTITSTPATAAWHSMLVERWGNAKMAASPAVNSVISGVGSPPSVTLTTTADNSVISTVSGDINSNDPATRAYLSGAVEDGLQDGHIGTNGVSYFYYQVCGAAGVQTVGMSAPSNQRWNLAAVEILDGGTPLVLADTPLPGARAGSTTDTLAIGVALADTPVSGVRAGNTIDTLTGQVVGTGADLEIGELSQPWSIGPIDTVWQANLSPGSWSAGSAEV